MHELGVKPLNRVRCYPVDQEKHCQLNYSMSFLGSEIEPVTFLGDPIFLPPFQFIISNDFRWHNVKCFWQDTEDWNWQH